MTQEQLQILSQRLAELLNERLDIQARDQDWTAHNDCLVIRYNGLRPEGDRENRRTNMLHICLTEEAQDDFQEREEEAWLQRIANSIDDLNTRLEPNHGRHDTPEVIKVILKSGGNIEIQ